VPLPTTLLEEALAAWKYTRGGVIAELENVPEEAIERVPPGGVRSAGDLARHILASGRLMAGELSRPDGDFQRLPPARLMAEHAGDADAVAGKEELLQALRSSQAEGERRLREAGELLMLQHIRQFNGEPATRLSWMHHGISHEEYHRGQIALTARLLGIVPALTRRIQGG
jgi:uncharacterized damage-inducible protein DinB